MSHKRPLPAALVTGLPARDSGTLAARPASPAAGDTYAVTSGVGTGDRYQCFAAGAWTLVSFDRDAVIVAPYLEWLLGETSGTFAQTGSASGGALTVTGSLVRPAGSLLGDSAPYFTASGGQYAEGAAALTPPAAAFSLGAWVRPSATSTATVLLKQYAASGWTSPYCSVYVYIQSNGRLRCGVAIGGSLSDLSPSTGEIVTVGQWHHVLMTWDGAGSPKRCLYLDGVLFAADSPSGTDVDWNASGPWQVSNGRVTEGLLGNVERARVWGVALTAARAREIYQRGVGAYRGQ